MLTLEAAEAGAAGIAVVPVSEAVSRVELNVEAVGSVGIFGSGGTVCTIGSRSGLFASVGTDGGAVPFAGKVDVIIAGVQIHMKY